MGGSAPSIRAMHVHGSGPIDQLTAEWEATGRTRSSREALGRLGAAEPEIARLGMADLGELVALLRLARRTAEREHAALVIRAMLRSQGVHPLVARATLQALLPGLVTVARRLSWGSGGDWTDGGAFFSDLIATTWEVIVSWSGQDRPYAVLDLLSAVRCRLRRQLVAQRSARTKVSLGLDPDEVDSVGTPGGVTALDDLARAIEDLAGRGLDRADAAVLYGHRVLGLSMAELARISGQTRRHLDGRRQRAEQELCA
ncbi:MAG TPA: hypothetical protein VKG43_09380 [Acidimicrobiales bacterium]|nr:hypothetical protein [Acidimicrobiales bacterium]